MAIELLNPRGVCQSPKNPIAPRLNTLDDKVLGLIDSSKDNADLFLDAVAELLKKHTVSRKRSNFKNPSDRCLSPSRGNFLINAIMSSMLSEIEVPAHHGVSMIR